MWLKEIVRIKAQHTVKPKIKAQRTVKPQRQIHQWSKAEWDKIREDSLRFQEEFLNEYHDIDSNYNKFCEHIEDTIKQHVPTKTSTSRRNIPWLTPDLKRLTRKKQ